MENNKDLTKHLTKANAEVNRLNAEIDGLKKAIEYALYYVERNHGYVADKVTKRLKEAFKK